MNFKKWVKSIQTAGYNVAHTVFIVLRYPKHIWFNLKIGNQVASQQNLPKFTKICQVFFSWTYSKIHQIQFEKKLLHFLPQAFIHQCCHNTRGLPSHKVSHTINCFSFLSSCLFKIISPFLKKWVPAVLVSALSEKL